VHRKPVKVGFVDISMTPLRQKQISLSAFATAMFALTFEVMVKLFLAAILSDEVDRVGAVKEKSPWTAACA
jgi:hypothetical protein